MDACTQRLRKDYRAILKEPVPMVWAAPQETNIRVWHYVLKGIKGSDFEGGYYYGKLKFPQQYPFKPPSILIVTPNGRFATNTRLCLTMSDFHPESWNPIWSVSTILTGLHNFFHEDSMTVGSISMSISSKRMYAKESMIFNLKQEHFVSLFVDLIDQIEMEKKKEEEEEAKKRGEQERRRQLQFEGKERRGEASGNPLGAEQAKANETETEKQKLKQKGKEKEKDKDRYGLGYALVAVVICILSMALVIQQAQAFST